MKKYENQDLVEGMLGKPDGELRDADGNVVGGMWLSPRSVLYDQVDEAVKNLLNEHGKLPATRESMDMIEAEVESMGRFAFVSIELAEPVAQIGYIHRLRVTTMTASILYP